MDILEKIITGPGFHIFLYRVLTDTVCLITSAIKNLAVGSAETSV
jgi:hypothetical protein